MRGVSFHISCTSFIIRGLKSIGGCGVRTRYLSYRIVYCIPPIEPKWAQCKPAWANRVSRCGLLSTNRVSLCEMSSLKKNITNYLFIYSVFNLENETCLLSYLMYSTRLLQYQWVANYFILHQRYDVSVTYAWDPGPMTEYNDYIWY